MKLSDFFSVIVLAAFLALPFFMIWWIFSVDSHMAAKAIECDIVVLVFSAILIKYALELEKNK